MKRFIHILLCLAATLSAAASPERPSAQQADDLYRQGNYAAAIDAYEALLADGLTNAELHYNLGNAYYREGEMGSAILHYERALRLRPSMTDAKENLALANSHTLDRITPLPEFFFVRWHRQLIAGTTPALWRTLWLVFFALLGASVVVLRLGRTLALRKAALFSTAIAALLTLAATAFLIDSTHRYNRHADAIVMEPSVEIKSSPEHQGTVKLVLHEGTKVHILDELSGWYKIQIADGTTGWCRNETAERI